MPKYNGHKNWNHWNVSLWINNDEGLYRMAREFVLSSQNKQAAASQMYLTLKTSGNGCTPDGAPYSVSAIRAAMSGMEG